MRYFLAVILLLAPTARAAERLNVLFIAVDDLRPELGTYGAHSITPNIDTLAASGLRFDRAYCNQAVCGASRVSLMTGLYPEFTGERSFHVTDWRKRWEETVTLNQHFVANGYKVVGLGKIYHGTSGAGVDPENWTEWVKVGGTQYASPESRKNMRVSRGSAAGGKKRRRGPSTESADVPEDTYADGIRAVTGAARLRALAKEDEPFFLAVGFTKPHLPFVAPKRFWDLYERKSFEMPANLGVPPGYPDFAREANAGELRSYSDIPVGVSPTEFPDPLNKRLIHGYSSYPHGRRGNTPVTGHSLRTDRYRYTEWWERRSDKVVAKALTDIFDDPGETTSALAKAPGEAERLSTMLRARVLAVRRK